MLMLMLMLQGGQGCVLCLHLEQVGMYFNASAWPVPSGHPNDIL